MKPKHSPAPWKAVDDGVGQIQFFGADGYSIAAVSYENEDGFDPETDKANARLMKAAPDLLEAAKFAINELQNLEWPIPTRYMDTKTAKNISILASAEEFLDKVIVQAEGKDKS